MTHSETHTPTELSTGAAPEILQPLRFPLAGTRLIEASAGTGKTFTIAALYLRLVLGHSHEKGGNDEPRPLSPEEILVVTFTKAATEELKDRIRQRLVEGAACFRGLSEGDDYLQSLKAEFEPAEHPRCALLLDLAAQLMDNAAIHTIHGWCQRMLREHAFDSGALFDTEMETDSSALLEQAVQDYWRSQFYPQNRETLVAVRELYGSPEALQKAVRPLLGLAAGGGLKREADPFELVAKRNAAVARCKDLWRIEWPQFCELFEQSLAQGWVKKNMVKPEQLGRLEAWLDGDGALPLDGRGAVLSRYTPGEMEKALSAAGKKQERSLAESPLLSALENLIRELDKWDLKPALLIDAALWIQQRIEAAKQRLAQLDFDDLIQHLGRALQQPEQGDRLAQLIRRQFPVALIDEFQDTDPTQYGIFQKLYLAQPDTALLMIGDPKQAIYAFRGADIHTYLQARRDTAGRHYTLDTNYRSTKAMVASANALFELGHRHPRNTFLYGEEIPFEPVKAKGKGKSLQFEGEVHPALTLWWDENPDNVWNKQMYLARQAKGCADRITAMLNGAQSGTTGFAEGDALTPLKESDIAILVRDFTEARAVRSALAANGVRSVYLSDKDSVFASEQAQDLIFILEAVAHPERESGVKAALATRTLGWDWAQIDSLNDDELAWESLLEQFRNLRLCWQGQGILPMIRQVLERFNVATRALSDPRSGERSLTNLLHLAELLQSVSGRFDGELALIRYLTEQCESGGELGDDQILRLESDAELVKVVTIHKSKGLEYPVVFLPFILGYRQASDQNGLLFYRDKNNDKQLTFNADDEARERADFERLAEDIRLLYVAMTRPSFACYLGLGPLKLGQRGKRGEPNTHLGALGCLLGAGAAQSSEQLLTELQALAGSDLQDVADAGSGIVLAPLPEPEFDRYIGAAQEGTLAPALTPPSRAPRAWWIASYSAMLRGMSHGNEAGPDPRSEQLLEIADEAEQTAPSAELLPAEGSIHAFPKGAAPGTFLHDLFEWAAEQGLAKQGRGFAGIDPQALTQEIDQRCERHGYAGQETMLLPWFERALTVPIPLPGGQAPSLLELEQVQAELEFWIATARVDTEQIDRLVTEAIWPGEARPALQGVTLNGMLKGFIDLTFCYQGQFFVADYKSNYLGPDESAYTPQAMREAMLAHRYDLQAALYGLALHRLLASRLPDYDFDHHMGGAVYLFLRGLDPDRPGNGALTLAPDKALILALDSLFREVSHVA
ncbi:exodeoxyribonuclease V subunit beta [Ferrimonas pelagia]|uniref:RecBCD enzyme subunit RecB n=1 Tax=Ferrimonas pelagia TaxID=1177826 RepID=A0ABP9EJ26_9GAMM